MNINISPTKIVISDNGKGFDLESVKKGYGLQNLAQRVKEIQGEYFIDTEVGKGTRIQVVF